MSQEVESKYLIPDRILFERMLQLERIGDYCLKPMGKHRVRDRYLDTPGHALLRQGWACRLRCEDRSWTVTLKGPAQVDASSISRGEWKVALPRETRSVSHWPHGELRQQIEILGGGMALRSLVRVGQTRHRFMLKDQDRPVAELTLDRVRFRGHGMVHKIHMLECELYDTGHSADLRAVDKILVHDYGLVFDPQSKLQRALDFAERGEPPDDALAKSNEPQSAKALAERYGEDIERAEQRVATAQTLFQALAPYHKLPEARLRPLESAALLSRLGETVEAKTAHLIARDIILRHPLRDHDEFEQQTAAAAVYLQRKKAGEKRIAEALPQDWSPTRRREAMTVAALLRMARALDRSDAVIQEVEVGEDRVGIVLTGPKPDQAVRRAERRSDLWQMLYDKDIEWLALDAKLSPMEKVLSGTKTLGIYPWDSVPQAAAKALAFYLDQALENEAGAKEGRDIEAVHDMRVATRRMRSVLRFFDTFLSDPELALVTPRLRRLARLLGQVRDMDVALLRAEQYLADQGIEAPGTLQPLLTNWQKRRARGQRRLVRYLETQAYAHWVEHFRTLLIRLREPGSVSESHTIEKMAPLLIHTHWETVQSYDTVIAQAPIELLHALRIECKRLRYGLEYCARVLPARVVKRIPDVIAAQDHLGEMNDYATTITMLDDYLIHRRRPNARKGTEAYRAFCRQQMAERVHTFPDAWKTLVRRKTRRAFDSLAE